MMSLHCSHMPVDASTKIIKNKLEEDGELQPRTSITIGHIITLLEFCLRNTHFLLQRKFFKQIEEAAVHSPISPVVASLYVEDFGTRAINTAENPKSMEKVYGWHICGAETAHWERFLEHINSFKPCIQPYKSKWFHAISWQLGDSRTCHHSLQKADTYRSILTLWQPPQHCCKI